MSRRNGSKEELPEFDWGNFSYKDSKRVRALTYEYEHRPEDASFEDELAFDEAFEKELAKLIVSVPRSWLVNDAPEEIDWSDVRSLEYIRGNKFGKLIKLAFADTEGN